MAALLLSPLWLKKGIIFIVLSFCVIVIRQPTKRAAEFEVLELGACIGTFIKDFVNMKKK